MLESIDHILSGGRRTCLELHHTEGLLVVVTVRRVEACNLSVLYSRGALQADRMATTQGVCVTFDS